MRSFLTGIFAVLLAPLGATTLQQLSLDDMIQKSTAIVRGRVQPLASTAKGSIVYTHYGLQVIEQWKGSPASSIDLAVPGGSANGVSQTYAGAPQLVPGQEYVFFLWTSRTGTTQVIGLSQGLFSVTQDGSGQWVAQRAASAERMLDVSGKLVYDSALSLPVVDLKNRVVRMQTARTGQ